MDGCNEMTHILMSSIYWKVESYRVPSCHLLVLAHNQERPTAAVTPIQVQNASGLGPASMGLPHHPLASPQPPPPMAAVSMGRASASLACAASASITSPSITSASLETEPSSQIMAILSGLPASPDSASSACGNSSAAKPDKDSKVRPTSCFSAGVVSHHFYS